MIDYFVGIDPGTYGAFAILDRDGRLESVVDLPTYGPEPVAADVAALLEAVAPAGEVFVGLEEPFPAPAGARGSIMNQGIGYGILLGVVGAGMYRHERIKPADWKRELGLPLSMKLSAAEKKRNSREHAARLWPEMAHRWEKASQDGRAEAALIGEAVRRRVLGR